MSAVADEMTTKGLKAVLILATDGLPTTREGLNSQASNNEFIRALRKLQTLPVWLVIRLFTDEEEVVNFYNNLDAQLEINLVSAVVVICRNPLANAMTCSNCAFLFFFTLGDRKSSMTS